MSDLQVFGTLGPACHNQKVLEQIFRAGATGMRLNLSHGNLRNHKDLVDNMKKAARECGQKCDLLIDMQGPELRTISYLSPKTLSKEKVYAVSELGFPACLLESLQPGMQILIDDGKILLEMTDKMHARVIRSGELLPRKSIGVHGLNLHLPVLTEDDLENLETAASFGVTGIMLPFVRSQDDLKQVRVVMNANGLQDARLYAKIESVEGVEMLESLLPYCDGIIIARGDLGDSVGLVNVASVQHYIEEVCRSHDKPYMVVTQMLDSMISHPVPTRAEVSDVYHAVYNGASSIMLTGETAAGKYPVEAMDYFVKIAQTAIADRNRR